MGRRRRRIAGQYGRRQISACVPRNPLAHDAAAGVVFCIAAVSSSANIQIDGLIRGW
jgi:hypothetical protein